MISEYALDPELVARWHDPRESAFFREAFADGTGRFGSTFPRQNAKKWRQAVFSTFRQCFPTETPESRAWQRMDALLERFSGRMVERDPGEALSGRWLDRAVEEHRRRPFQGILSAVPVTGVAEVLTPEMLFEDRPPAAWSAPRCPPVPRTAADFAKVLRPLLLRCREVVFVDPWFDPNKPEFTDPLRAMLEVLWGPGRGVDSPSAQLVIAEGGHQGKRDAHWLMDGCRKRLPRILPAGRCLTVTVLRQRTVGQKIHNRYVLTIFCGVSFGTGLDAAGDGGTGQTDDLCRLTREQLDARWGTVCLGPWVLVRGGSGAGGDLRYAMRDSGGSDHARTHPNQPDQPRSHRRGPAGPVRRSSLSARSSAISCSWYKPRLSIDSSLSPFPLRPQCPGP